MPMNKLYTDSAALMLSSIGKSWGILNSIHQSITGKNGEVSMHLRSEKKVTLEGVWRRCYWTLQQRETLFTKGQ